MSDGATRIDLDSAERIVRSLVGVADVRVHADETGRLARVLVATAPGVQRREIALNVVSALRATFGIDIGAENVLLGPIVEESPVATSPRQPPNLVHFPADPVHTNGNGNGKPTPPSVNGNGKAPSSVASIRLENVEVVRDGGRVRCRVVLVSADGRWIGAADAPDLPGEELRLVARVTADALRASRAAMDPIQVDDATVAHVAGRPHALVAIRVWHDQGEGSACGAEPVGESIERAAAQALIRAALSARN